MTKRNKQIESLFANCPVCESMQHFKLIADGGLLEDIKMYSCDNCDHNYTRVYLGLHAARLQEEYVESRVGEAIAHSNENVMETHKQ